MEKVIYVKVSDSNGQQTKYAPHKYWIKINRNNLYHTNYSGSPIYYWKIIDHNLFDKNDPLCQLFFIDPNFNRIVNTDPNQYKAISQDGRLYTIYQRLKYQEIKMSPKYFIARSVQAIIEALNYVNFCVVKTINHEQYLVDL
ncbi:MAG: hypothetical protein ABIN35_00435 [candidate division WOR-3 bacterium]